MITKAGVPSYKIFVGITSYGRSFKMAEPGCDGPMCLYLGERNLSPAAPGYCTNTSGYISEAEIRQIRKMSDYEGDDSYYEFYDKASDSDIIVYNDVEWYVFPPSALPVLCFMTDLGLQGGVDGHGNEEQTH